MQNASIRYDEGEKGQTINSLKQVPGFIGLSPFARKGDVLCIFPSGKY